MPATKIIDHVHADHCLPRLEGDSREDVIQELANAFVASGALSDEARDVLTESTLEREEAATTGVGLHAGGVDFRALDGEPVYIVFLVASPGKVEYLEVAKRIAALAKGGSAPEKWRRVLRQSKTGAALREALEEAWEELAP